MLFREDDEEVEPLPFTDRAEAGRILAAQLSVYAGRSDVVIIGLARGGVAVGFEIARALRVPLDVFVVRKLGVPWNKELAMGAIAPGDIRLLDRAMVEELSISEQEIQITADAELQELQRREQLYHRNRTPISLAGKTVIVVDDGVATGSSVLAAIRALRQQPVKRIIVAIPVAPASSCNVLQMEADELVCSAQPEFFIAISQWYKNFGEVNDEEICALLEKSSATLDRAA